MKRSNTTLTVFCLAQKEIKKLLCSFILGTLLIIPFSGIGQGNVNVTTGQPGASAKRLPIKQGGQTTTAKEVNPLKLKWKVEPFDHTVFVENRGQFDTVLGGNQKILFGAKIGIAKAFFTASGVIFNTVEVIAPGKDSDHDGMKGDPDASGKNPYFLHHYQSATWQGANTGVTVDAGEKQSYDYTYGAGKSGTIRAALYKKITYHNIYPGIDVEYSIPSGNVGLKYSVIVHPGADISQVKLAYAGAKALQIDKNGNITEESDDSKMANLMDHSPVSFYEGGGNVNITYAVNGRTESFIVNGAYDNTKTVVIDPLTSLWNYSTVFPASGGYNNGYDVDYDYAGNVYVYGGYYPFELTKLNSAGVKQWTYQTTFAVEQLYGDFCVDKAAGISYIAEGIDNTTGAAVDKVDPTGALLANFPGSGSMLEIWRMAFNACTDQAVCGGGGVNAPIGQVAMLDPNMTTFTPKNPLNTSGYYRDVDRLSMDPNGSTAYFGISTESSDTKYKANDSNQILSVPVPALYPATYDIGRTGESYLEVGSVWYVGPGVIGYGATANGFNGMIASPNYLYTWDGYNLYQRNKGTGAVISGPLTISTPYASINQTVVNNYCACGYPDFKETDVYWAGIDADACDNVYIGTVAETSGYPASLQIYNSSFALQSTTALPDWPYDVVLGQNDATVYVCGGPDNFLGNSGTPYLEAFTNSISTVVATATVVTNSTCGLPNGSAQAGLTLCGGTPPSVNYSWSPSGGTNSLATGLAAGTYTVSMNIGCGSVYQATVTIGSNPAPTLTASAAPSTICSGSSSTLSASGTTTYLWNDGETTSSIIVTPAVTTTYTVNGSSSGCAAAPVTVVVTVNPSPTVTVTSVPSATVCAGSSATLNASGGTTYLWNDGETTSSIVVTPGTSTTYTVTGTTGGCNSSPSTIAVTVNPLPTINVTSSGSLSICSGNGDVHLTASGASTYTWAAASGLTNTNQDTTTAAPGSSTTYTVSGTDANGCVGTQTVAISVSATPTLTISPPGSASICSGTSVQLTGSGATTYSWSPSTGLTNVTADTTTASPSSTTTYTLTGTTAGCTGSLTYTVNVTPTPTVGVTPASPGVCPGDTAVLTASGATTYLWSTGETTDTIIAHPGSTTTYTVTGNNGSCSSQAIVTVTVGALTVTATATKPTICSGTSTLLTASGASTYLWNTGSTNDTMTVNPTSATTYTVTGTSGSGCNATGTVVVNVNPSPSISSVSSVAGKVCPGDTTSAGAVITGGTGPFTYSWSNGETTATDTGLGAGTYVVNITDANGCTTGSSSITINVNSIVVTATASSTSVCTGTSAVLTANPTTGYIYSWTPAGTLLNPASDTTTAYPAGTTTYWVMADSGKCKDSASVTVTVNPIPVVTVTASDTNMCSGTSSILTGGGAATYSWMPGPLSGSPVTVTPGTSTTYTVTGTTLGCSSTATVSIAVNPTPTVTISLSSTGDTVCSGSSVTLTANGTATTYLWSNSSVTSSITVNPTVATTYTVIATSGACSDTVSQPVYVYAPFNVTMTGDSICSGRVATVSVNATGGGKGYSYVWTPVEPNTSSISVTANSTMYYICSVSDACGDKVKDSAQVFTFVSPVASFAPTPNPVPGGEYVAFVDNSTNANAWFWTFGDGGTSTVSFPYHVYDTAGNYYATLLVISKQGCRDSIGDSIHVVETIYIPNVFTPNGDGVNDVFHVTATSMKEYSIEIFNRWGEKVFESNSPNIDWNGKSQSGVMESDGTYYYMILATDYAGKNFKYDGYLQLIGGQGQ